MLQEERRRECRRVDARRVWLGVILGSMVGSGQWAPPGRDHAALSSARGARSAAESPLSAAAAHRPLLGSAARPPCADLPASTHPGPRGQRDAAAALLWATTAHELHDTERRALSSGRNAIPPTTRSACTAAVHLCHFHLDAPVQQLPNHCVPCLRCVGSPRRPTRTSSSSTTTPRTRSSASTSRAARPPAAPLALPPAAPPATPPPLR